MAVFTRWRAAAVLALAFSAMAADPGADLLRAARQGDTPRVRALLDAGAGLEARDKNGRTPLLCAAEQGHADTVRLLLDRGAESGARDREGLTAYGLALFSLDGAKRAAVLAALPRPPVLRLSLIGRWSPENMTGSCFLGRDQLYRFMTLIHPDALVVGALADSARLNGKDIVDIVRADAEGLKADVTAGTASVADADAIVVLEAKPALSCAQQFDRLSLAIDVRVWRAGSQTPVFEKTFGGGLTGLHAQQVTSPAQVQPLLENWARSHASSIYGGVLRALMRQ
ncbi:MAG: ankyrin repeat domain-containing protein [Bryobacteraceae bacterium]|jgi:hypothetical protein